MIPSDAPLNARVFLEGPAGCGKTTFGTRHLLRLLESGIAPDRILVLVPQVTLGRPYQLAVHGSPIAGGMVDVLTLSGVARRAIETYWPVVAGPMGFAEPGREPTFLNIETAQYFMARIAAPAIELGQFSGAKGGVALSPARIISQVLFNLNEAAILRFPLDEVAERLINAWGERDSARRPVFRTALELAGQFREYCLAHNLLDFSLALEAFHTLTMNDTIFLYHFVQRYNHLIVDNIEEDTPAAHDFLRWLTPQMKSALLICDSDGGYRVFLGADPDNALGLAALCEEHVVMEASVSASPAMLALTADFNRAIGPTLETESHQPSAVSHQPGDSDSSLAAFSFEFHRYYPQMLDWVVAKIRELVSGGVAPRQIAVVAPFLGDALRFSLSYALNQAGIPTLSHRPSRALQDEPVTRAMLTLAVLANPAWGPHPPLLDVADALALTIGDLDPVRARLLAHVIYRTGTGALSTFAEMTNTAMQERITFLAGERYDALQGWLMGYRVQHDQDGPAPLDHFLSRLFGEVLSQPGYRFHGDLESGRVAAQLIESARRFRRTLYGDEQADWNAAGSEYLGLVRQRLLSALYVQSWQDEESDAVFLAPATTFLMRNRFVDYQFWLDVGSGSWSERLEQPLTHPYVLRRDYPREMVWTDEMEDETQVEQLYKIVIGLARRCRQHIYLGIADLGESGFEQRGMLLRVFQQILRRNTPGEAPGPAPDSEAA